MHFIEFFRGGRVAEELAFGVDDITTGASSDLQSVAGLARRMVTQWGFSSDSLGATAWESPDGSGFGMPQMASEATQQRIDAEVQQVVDKAYKACKATLTANRKLLDELTSTLIKDETIGPEKVKELVQLYAVKA